MKSKNPESEALKVDFAGVNMKSKQILNDDMMKSIFVFDSANVTSRSIGRQDPTYMESIKLHPPRGASRATRKFR